MKELAHPLESTGAPVADSKPSAVIQWLRSAHHGTLCHSRTVQRTLASLRRDPLRRDIGRTYQRLPSLQEKICKRNPGTKFGLEWDDDGTFRRLYVCPRVSLSMLFASLAVYATDGTHLRGVVEGVLLLFSALTVHARVMH